MNTYFDLFEHIVTKSQLMETIEKISNVVDKLYTNQFTADEVMKEELPYFVYEAFYKNIKEKKIDMNDKGAIKNYFEESILELKTIPIVLLTISFLPSMQTLHLFSNCIADKMRKKIIFDLKIDPEIIGGAIVQYNGVYKNYSLKNRMTV